MSLRPSFFLLATTVVFKQFFQLVGFISCLLYLFIFHAIILLYDSLLLKDYYIDLSFSFISRLCFLYLILHKNFLLRVLENLNCIPSLKMDNLYLSSLFSQTAFFLSPSSSFLKDHVTLLGANLISFPVAAGM